MKLPRKLELNLNNIVSKSILNALNILETKDKRIEIEKFNTTNNVLIETIDLCKEFGIKDSKRIVLNKINLKIYEGENIALIGSNGAGKTTLIEILAGLSKQTSGIVKYLYQYNKSFQENLGIQFQDSSYPPAITVREVIKFMIDIYGCKLSNDELVALIKIFGIDEYFNKRASKLSGGQQQRLNVLLALIHKPKVIFLDELSTGLDISIRTRIKNFIKDYAFENKITIILVSHDMNEVKQLCERLVFLKEGKIILDEKIKKILVENDSLENFVESLL